MALIAAPGSHRSHHNTVMTQCPACIINSENLVAIPFVPIMILDAEGPLHSRAYALDCVTLTSTQRTELSKPAQRLGPGSRGGLSSGAQRSDGRTTATQGTGQEGAGRVKGHSRSPQGPASGLCYTRSLRQFYLRPRGPSGHQQQPPRPIRVEGTTLPNGLQGKAIAFFFFKMKSI